MQEDIIAISRWSRTVTSWKYFSYKIEKLVTHGTECPTGAALALVLDLGDSALLAPVHLVGVLDVRRRDEGGGAGVAALAVQALVVPASGITLHILLNSPISGNIYYKLN